MVGMHLTKTRGGITTLTSAILNSALKHDYDFIYLASQAEDFRKFRKVLLALYAVTRFIAVCLLKRPSLVYIHVGSNASLYRESAFILLARLLGRPVLSHFHAGDIDNYYPQQPRLGKDFIRMAIGLSDAVIAVSQESARQLRQFVGASNILTIPNSIDTSAFSPGRKAGKGEAVRLLFVGAVGKLKGEEDLISALAILKASDLNLTVSFLGYGADSLAERCEELDITGLIDHLGPVSMDQRIAFFEQADIFVLPTYAEAMPISLIEAMAAGLAIISTPVGGIPELVEDGREALLAPVGDVEVLAEKIALLVTNEEARTAVGRNARKRAVEQMDFAKYVKRLRSEMNRVSKTDRRI